MPSSAEHWAQQAAWRMRGCQSQHLSVADALAATSLMNDLQEALCAEILSGPLAAGLFRKGSC